MQSQRSRKAPTPCLLGHLQPGRGPQRSRETASHPLPLVYGLAQIRAGPSEDRGADHPSLCGPAGIPLRPPETQRAQGPCLGDGLGWITQRKTGNINTGFVLVWPSEALRNKENFPAESSFRVCRTKKEGHKPSLTYSSGSLVCMLGYCLCVC